MSNKSIFQGNRVSDDNTLALPNFNPRTNKYLDRVIPPKPKENIIADYNSIMNGYDNPEQTRPNHHHNNASIATKSQSNIQANHHSADQNLRNSINFFTKEAYRQVSGTGKLNDLTKNSTRGTVSSRAVPKMGEKRGICLFF